MTRKRRSERSGMRFEIVMRGCRQMTPRAAPVSRESGAASGGGKGLSRLPIHYFLLAVFAALLATAYSPLPAFAQTKTTVSDTIHGPDGSLPSGKIVITSKSTFTASDGTVVFSGVVATATVTNGAFSVALVPNAGSTPSGTSYSAIYKLAGVPYREETWVVPASATPVSLSAVRSTSLSGPSAMVSASQMPALSGDVNSSAGSASASVVGLHWGSSGYTLSGAPSDGQCLTVSGFTITGGACGSGSGQPAGSSGQVQMNNGGSFAGAADLTYDTASGATTLIARDKGGQVFNVKAYGAAGDGTTDDTAAFQAAINAACPSGAGGGVIESPPGIYLIAGALTLPNDGGSPPNQCTLIFRGAGMARLLNGPTTTAGATAPATVLDLTETSNTVAKFDSRGKGFIEFQDLTLEDSGSDSIPFVHVTNTSIQAHRTAFIGTGQQQDAIVLGGTTTTTGGSAATDAFQGYGTVISSCYFDYVRHAVLEQVYANGVQVTNNTVWSNSGSSTSGDGAIVVDAGGVYTDIGGYLAGNLIEANGYAYGIVLNDAWEFVLSGNNFYDRGVSTVAGVRFGANGLHDIVICGRSMGIACADSAGSPDFNTVIATDNGGNQPTLFGSEVDFEGALNVTGSTVPQTLSTVGSGGNIEGWGMKSSTTNDYSAWELFPGATPKLELLMEPAGGPAENPWRISRNSSTWTEMTIGKGGDTRLDLDGAINGNFTIFNAVGNLCLGNVADRNNCFTATQFKVDQPMTQKPVAFASALACNSTNEGTTQAFTDSTTATWGATISGSGSNHVLGYCDGTNWTVAGK